ncbi:MAG: NnrU family protein [Pseudomonadota bacterium]
METSPFHSEIAAALLLVGGHFLLSSHPLRALLIERLKPEGFRLAYSFFAVASLVWLILAYGEAPQVALWPSPAWGQTLALLVMPVASILVFAGLTTPNPTMVGGEKILNDTVVAARGILTITRHPFLWGVTAWSVTHLLVLGDLASVIFFGSFAVLALGGMRHIDLRRQRDLDASWAPLQLTTSLLPLAAVLAGRTRIDWKGIGWWRLLGGLTLFVFLLQLHPWVLGASPLH